MDIIYADELFFLNTLVDYLLLLASARLRNAPLRRVRFAAAAAAGGVYAVFAAIPVLGWLRSGAVKLAYSLLMALIAFGSVPGLWRSWLWFLALSAAFGGAVFAVGLLSGQGSDPLLRGISFRVLLLSFGLCYAAVQLIYRRLLRQRQQRLISVLIAFGGKTVTLTALRDTGNELTDPVSGAAVLIAEAAALAPLFPPETVPLLGEKDAAALFRALSSRPEFSRRLRLIPYAAVGTSGLLTAFRPDSVTVEGEAQELLVAVSPTPFGRGEYTAIV